MAKQTIKEDMTKGQKLDKEIDILFKKLDKIIIQSKKRIDKFRKKYNIPTEL